MFCQINSKSFIYERILAQIFICAPRLQMEQRGEICGNICDYLHVALKKNILRGNSKLASNF